VTRATALGLAGIALAAGCALNPVTRQPEVVLVSEAAERRMGAEQAEQLEMQPGLLDAPELSRYVDEVGQRLARASPRPELDWHFRILDLEDQNAFALPGGHVYVTRGLLVYLNSEDELAFVLAHEIGHVSARHAVQRITRAAPLAMATGIPAAAVSLVLPGAGRALGNVGLAVNAALLAPYGRSQEMQADRLGQRLVAESGWDPGALETFLRTLERESAQRGEEKPPWFLRTHPLSGERIEAGKASMPASPVGSPETSDRAEFLAHLEGLRVGHDPAQGVFDGSTFRHPVLDLAIDFPADWMTWNAPDFVAATHPDGEVAVVLEIAGMDEEPLVAARRFAKGPGAAFGLLPRETLLAGRPGARAYGRGDGAALDVSWVAYGGRVYQISGTCPLADYERFQTDFIDVPLSLRELTPEERDEFEQEVLHVATAREGETLAQLTLRVGSLWDEETAAIANALEPGESLHAGQQLKFSVLRPYQVPPDPEEPAADGSSGDAEASGS